MWRMTPVAAKIAHTGFSPAQKALVLRELEVMTRLRHPNVVQFLGYVDIPFCVVLEYLPMGDLRHYWKSRRVSNAHKSRICVDVLRALAYLHNRKPSSIIHRDVKPTNVVMTKSGVAKLADFGLGRFTTRDGLDDSKHAGDAFASKRDDSKRDDSKRESLDNSAQAFSAPPSPQIQEPPRTRPLPLPEPLPHIQLADATAIVGTAPYMAPEANTADYDAKVDIFSAAVTFYELFEQACFDPSLPFGWALTPTRFRPLIRLMGSDAPKARPSALQLIHDFGACSTKGGVASVACTLS